MRTQRGLLCGFSYFKYTGIRALPTVSWTASWKQKHSDSLSEGVIHLIKSKTFCSKKAFLGNKSNSEVRSSVEVVKTRTLWKRSLSHAPFGGHHLRVQISCVVNVFYGQGRCRVVHWSYIAESTNSENLFKHLLCAEHFLWPLGSKRLQYPRESELKHSRKCSRDKVWRSAEGSVGASSPPPEQDGAVVAHSRVEPPELWRWFPGREEGAGWRGRRGGRKRACWRTRRPLSVTGGGPPVRPRRGSALGSPGSGPVSRVTGRKAEVEGNMEVEGTVRDR